MSSQSERVLEARKARVWPDAEPGSPEYEQTYEGGPPDNFKVVRCPVCGHVEPGHEFLLDCALDHPAVPMELVLVRVVEVLRRVP